MFPGQVWVDSSERAAADNLVTEADFNKLFREALVQIESTLRPDQFPFWRSLAGEYYDLSPQNPAPQPAESHEQTSQPAETGQVPEQSNPKSTQE